MTEHKKTTKNEVKTKEKAKVPAVRSKRQTDRELAKIGLMVTMGALVITGMSRTRSARKAHVVAGGIFIGLSVWHHMLYAPANNNNAERRNGGGGL